MLTVRLGERSSWTSSLATSRSRCLSGRGRTPGAGCAQGRWCAAPALRRSWPAGPAGCGRGIFHIEAANKAQTASHVLANNQPAAHRTTESFTLEKPEHTGSATPPSSAFGERFWNPTGFVRSRHPTTFHISASPRSQLSTRQTAVLQNGGLQKRAQAVCHRFLSTPTSLWFLSFAACGGGHPGHSGR